jgi:hypothetical protein
MASTPLQSLNSKNSAYNLKNGRYVLGGTSEVGVQTLEWWSKAAVKRDPSDLVYFMERKYENRPDMLGYVFYGDPGLWWIIAQYNNILDPVVELVEGTLLLIPTLDRIKQVYSTSAKVGGIPSTR